MLCRACRCAAVVLPLCRCAAMLCSAVLCCAVFSYGCWRRAVYWGPGWVMPDHHHHHHHRQRCLCCCCHWVAVALSSLRLGHPCWGLCIGYYINGVWTFGDARLPDSSCTVFKGGQVSAHSSLPPLSSMLLGHCGHRYVMPSRSIVRPGTHSLEEWTVKIIKTFLGLLLLLFSFRPTISRINLT